MGEQAAQAVAEVKQALPQQRSHQPTDISEGWEDEDGWELLDDGNVPKRPDDTMKPQEEKQENKPHVFEEVEVFGDAPSPADHQRPNTTARRSTIGNPSVPVDPAALSRVPMRARKLVRSQSTPTPPSPVTARQDEASPYPADSPNPPVPQPYRKADPQLKDRIARLQKAVREEEERESKRR
ncbi:hypothetical protein VTJ04DRAFT_4256 [Mycothermus thermophilus]|uniref:uncharacterized protein n=1 Tax=Humicola insolens TaxID=85995 RepID=UPI0037431104